MFFNLPDGTRFTAKATKKGQYLYGVAAELLIPTSDGHNVSHWTLASQHLTRDAAQRAGVTYRKSQHHLNDLRLIEAA